MNHFYGYIRVSTAKQGERGVSLVEQKTAIERHADRNSLVIGKWFEEQETAAKRGRPVFSQMLRLLRSGKAAGVIIHKIDRSARNLRDWADLGELIDAGIVVHFANESLDLNSRGGRLSADIQAVVAADYIRNLREETKKGFYGRLKQGFYPRPAPLGYNDQGAAKPKTIDPVQGPLIRQAFEYYGTGRFNLDGLVDTMYRDGLRTRGGKPVSRAVIARILHNPFYIGLVRIEKARETYQGNHEPLVSVSLFRRVQDTLSGRVCRRSNKHRFLFRQMWTCSNCQRCLIGETHKGVVYYRCHHRGCMSKTARESALNSELLRHFKKLEFAQVEKNYFRAETLKLRESWQRRQEETISALRIKLSQIEERLNRLTDAYLDQVLDKESFEQRKAALLMERRSIEEQTENLRANDKNIPDQLSELVELAGCAYLAYKHAEPDEKRDLVKTLSSNRTVNGKSLMIMLNTPFNLIANRFSVPGGRPFHTAGRDVPHIWDELLSRLSTILVAQSKTNLDAEVK